MIVGFYIQSPNEQEVLRMRTSIEDFLKSQRITYYETPRIEEETLGEIEGMFTED